MKCAAASAALSVSFCHFAKGLRPVRPKRYSDIPANNPALRVETCIPYKQCNMLITVFRYISARKGKEQHGAAKKEPNPCAEFSVSFLPGKATPKLSVPWPTTPTVAGFTERDTFRRNQIREGDLTREEAMELVQDENQPRYPNLKWYLDAIDFDFKSTIEAINRIPKLYHH